MNQFFMSPGLNGGFFAFVIWTRTAPKLLMTSDKRAQLMAKFKQDLLPTCARSCVYWTIVQGINFKLLPEKYGVLFVNAAFVVWTTYLSLIGNRAASKAE